MATLGGSFLPPPRKGTGAETGWEPLVGAPVVLYASLRSHARLDDVNAYAMSSNAYELSLATLMGCLVTVVKHRPPNGWGTNKRCS